jgi:hypothetical protein
MSGGNGMLSDLIRQSREAPGRVPPAPVGEAAEGADELPCFARLRGARQVAFMLELRGADGNSEALDYGLLARARFDPSAGLVLHFHGVTATVRGRKLRPLYEAILAHRVTWVEVAANPDTVARDPDATVVTAIEVETD